MASSPGPATPNTTPQRAQQPPPTTATTNRSFTVPAKLTTPSKPSTTPSETSTSTGIETLYQHPNARVLKFSTRGLGSTGTLPWASPTEHTIASGALEIYRVPGSVSFLRLGSGAPLLQILPRSQCWCVDGASKFAFRAKEPETYFRVELSTATEEEREGMEKFVEVLKRLSFYERTSCPFARGFSVELPLPEEGVEVRRKRRRGGGEKAKKWRLSSAHGWKPEGWEPGMDVPEGGEEEEGSGSSASLEGSEDDSEDAPGDGEGDAVADGVKGTSIGPSMRAKAIQALRSVSAPQSQPSMIHSTLPARSRKQAVEVDGAVESRDAVEDEEAEQEVHSLRSFQAIPTDMPPSPPDSSAGLDYLESRSQVGSLVEARSTVESEDTVAGAEPAEVRDEDNEEDDEDNDRLDAESTKSAHQDEARIVERIAHEEALAEVSNVSLDGVPDRRTDLATTILDEPIEQPGQVADSIDSESSDTEEGKEAVSGSDAKDDETNNPEHVIPKPVEDLDGTRDGLDVTAASTEMEERAIDDIAGSDGESDQQSETPAVALQPLGVRDEETANASERDQSEDQPDSEADNEGSEEEEQQPTTPPQQLNTTDPYAAIQARILARRSLSGATTSWHPPLHNSPTRSSTSSTSSSATIISNKDSRTQKGRRRQDAASTSLANRAYSAFLGPPAQLVGIMLKVASRFANGAFGVDSMFYVESPLGSPRRVPGDYGLRGDYMEEVYVDSSDWEDQEDDFGVPFDRPASSIVEGRERRSKGVEVD